MLKFGSVLKNGATAIAFRDNGDRRVVLASWWRNDRDEFVTWCVDPTGETMWGHYFMTDLPKAVNDFVTR